MTVERIKEIQMETAYPNSMSVQQALFKVWNECAQNIDYEENQATKTIQTQDNDFLVWDKLFAKLAWKFQQTKSGDMLIDAEAVYEELKNEFNLTFKQQEQ
jgi:hypothetical protein